MSSPSLALSIVHNVNENREEKMAEWNPGGVKRTKGGTNALAQKSDYYALLSQSKNMIGLC